MVAMLKIDSPWLSFTCTVCSSSSLLVKSMVWPARTRMNPGTNWRPIWSMVVVSSGSGTSISACG